MLVVALHAVVLPALAIEIDDSPSSKVQQGIHEDLVTVDDQRFLVADYSQLPEGGFEVFEQVPKKYAGPFSRISPGAEIPRAEIIKIIDAHFKETAFNYDSIKVRKIEASWPRYVAGCSVPTLILLCASRTYLAGTVVTFESNGQNRLGGMAGFQPVTWLVRNAVGDSSLTDGGGDSRSGLVAPATDSQLHAHLSPEVVTGIAADPAAILRTARALLEQRGFNVTEDTASGGLVTAARQFKLTADQADCGKIMGIGFIRDKRTETTVLLTVSAADAQMHVQMAIDGVQHVKALGGGSSDNVLNCRSLGTYEKALEIDVGSAVKQQQMH